MASVVETRDTEVPAKARRRRFTAEYKQRILWEADRCQRPGEIGALLRREGLYSSHLTVWRSARERAEREALRAKRRGPKPKARDGRDTRIGELECEVSRWKRRAERAEALVEIQKKVSTLLGIDLDENGEQR